MPTWSYSAPREYFGRVEHVPLTETYKGMDIAETRRVTVANTGLLAYMLCKYPKLKFKCLYDAVVCDEKGNAGNSGTSSTIRMEQEVCIIETALKFITCYFQTDSHDELLRFVAESLKCVYFVAMSLAATLDNVHSCISDTKDFRMVMLSNYPKRILVDSEEARMQYIRKHALRISKQKHDELLAATDETPEQQGEQEQSRVLSELVIQEDVI